MSTTNPPITTQISGNGPIPPQLSSVTDPLVLPQQLLFRLRNFPSETYTITPDSHIYRLMSVLLGEGAGAQLRKRGLVNRLRQVMSGTNFLDLDGFYGALFGLTRTTNELLSVNPYTDTNSIAGWVSERQADASYRDRIYQFSKALMYGPSILGIKFISEAVLSTPVEVTLGTQYSLANTNTTSYNSWGIGQWGIAQWGESDTTTTQTVPISYGVINVSPHTNITIAQQNELYAILSATQSASSIINIGLTGVQNYTPITLSGAWADSYYWEVDFTVDSTGTVYTSNNKQQYAFGATQGDYWSLNGFINNTLSYVNDSNGNTILPSDNQMIVWQDGTNTVYSSQLALLPNIEAQLGYLSQVGVTQSNPINNTTTVSPIIVNGIPLSDLSSIGGTSDNGQQFWSSFPRYNDDLTQDVVEFRLSETHIVNNISFQVANFPQNITVQYYDSTSASWQTLYQQTVSGSVPNVITNTYESLVNHTHPQHYGNGHWVNITFRITATSMNDIRIVCQRYQGVGPFDVNGNPVAYSTGIQGFNINYIVDSIQALPVVVSGNNVIDSSLDLYGNRLTHTVYQEVPSGPVFGSGQWRSAPQPSVNSVVNYYVDTRDGTSTSQVVDRFYIEPTHLGVHINLYWTNDEPNGTGLSLNDNIQGATFYGVQTTVINGLQFSAINENYISLPSVGIRLPNADWWAGISFQGSANTIMQLADIGGTKLSINNNTLILTTTYGDYISLPIIVNPGEVCNVFFGYVTNTASGLSVESYFDIATYDSSVYGVTGIGTLYLAYQTQNTSNQATYEIDNERNWGGVYVHLGSWLSNPIPSGITLSYFVLKSESLNQDTIDGFLANPIYYCDQGVFPGQSVDLTQNAYVRFVYGFISDSNPTGCVGGTPDVLANLNWTPLGQYISTKGYMNFEPIKANFFKLEFTNLVAEPYTNFIPISRTSNFYPGSISVSSSGYQGNVPAGYATQAAIGSGQVFSADTPNFPAATPVGNYLPTQTLVASDPGITQSLGTQYPGQFNYTNWHQGYQAIGQTSPGVSNYASSTINNTAQIGFFAGLISIAAYRSEMTSNINNTLYIENFLDDIFFTVPTGMTLTSGDLSSVTSNQTFVSEVLSVPYVVTSLAFPSNADVISLQFATVQTDPVQLVRDDQFISPQYINYDWQDTTIWHAVGDAQITYNANNNEVLIVRNALSNPLASYHSLVRPVVSPVQAESVPDGGQELGGLESSVLLASNGGMLYVAIDGTIISGAGAGGALSSALLVQLVNSNNEDVVAEWSINGSANQNFNEYFSYPIGSGAAAGTPLRVRVIQQGISTDSWIVSALSVFDEAIIWSFSNNGGTSFTTAIGIKNNRYSTLTFPVPTTNVATNQIVWKATVYRTNVHINTLRMRPTYQNQGALLPSYMLSGPNLSSQLTIAEDPYFNGWDQPIPQSWYQSYQNKILVSDAAYLISAYGNVYSALLTETATPSDSVSTKVHYYLTLTETTAPSDSFGIKYTLALTETTTHSDSVNPLYFSGWGAGQWGNAQWGNSFTTNPPAS